MPDDKKTERGKTMTPFRVLCLKRGEVDKGTVLLTTFRVDMGTVLLTTFKQGTVPRLKADPSRKSIGERGSARTAFLFNVSRQGDQTRNRPLCSARLSRGKMKGTVKVLRRDGNTAEAIPLYADWIPQANGFAASPVNPQRRESPEVSPRTVNR